MKLAFVTPRYGTEVVGGAEYAARMLAERVVSQLDWDVEILTSRALDAGTWADHYDEGLEVINGVKVHRHSASGRHKNFPQTSELVHRNTRAASETLQQQWFEEQGPTSPTLIESIRTSDADVFAFYPYLYHPTVVGLPLVADRAVMHPAAHDEAPIHMSMFKQVFGQAQGFVYHTEEERHLVEGLFPIAHRPQLSLGLGIETFVGDGEVFRARHNLGDAPFVLCLGRVDEGKGAHMLAAYFANYKLRNPSNLKLVFVGPVMQPVPPHADIVMAGKVSDEDKWAALQECAVFVSPSAFESFSLVLIEAWTANKATIVNRACSATMEHTEASQGGLSFSGYGDFEAALHRLLTDRALAAGFAAAGKRYVEARFQWPALIERYGKFIEQVAARAAKKRASL